MKILTASRSSALFSRSSGTSMGGLVVATALTLVFVPALYAAWFRIRRDSPSPVPADAQLGDAARPVGEGSNA